MATHRPVNSSNTVGRVFRRGQFLAGLACVLCVAGCAPNRQYHGPFAGVEHTPARAQMEARKAGSTASIGNGAGSNIYHVKVKHPDLPRPFKLGFIEIDDTGKFFNPQQLGNILKDIRGQKRLLLFVFIHGWQNNARIYGGMDEFLPNPEGDAQRFKNYLALLANSEVAKRRDANIYGVFIGWRGELIEKSPEPVSNRLLMTLPRAATFFSRKAAATRVGDSAAAGVALTAIQEATKPGTPPSPDDPVRVFMGHSFGSKVLEQAVAQWFARKVAEQIGRDGGVQSFTTERFADLVLFLNSAGESEYANRVLSALPIEDDFNRKQPYFVSVTSDTDMATKVAFPIGTTIGTALGSFQKAATEGISGALFYRRTTVFNQYLINGHVDLLEDQAWHPDKGLFPRTPETPVQVLARPKDADYVKQALRVIDYNLAADPFSGEGMFRVYAINGTVSKINFYTGPEVRNRTGFWVLGANKELMNGHSDVWGPNCISLYTKLFRLAFLNRVVPGTPNPGITMRGTHEMQLHIPYNF